MRRHIDLLGLLYVVGGVLSVVAAASLLALSLGAFSIGRSAEGESAAFAAGVTGVAFASVALLMAAWGGANALVGRALRRFSPGARLACFALAVLNLFLLPFGTALSVYTVWVLLHPESRRLLSSGTRS
jgi:hypothetical protein